jgi:hypothetical protein
MVRLLCFLLVACDPVPTVPVPTAPIEPDGLAEQPTPGKAPVDTGSAPVIDANRAPVITSIAIEPATPRTTDDLEATVEAEDPERDHVRFDYTWLVNGREIAGQRWDTLPHTYTTKGDRVQLKVLAKSGEHEIEGLSSLIIVRNTPPEITNRSSSFRQVDGFRVEAEDIDGDKLSFRLEGAPEGMGIDAGTGVMSYQGSEAAEAGDYKVQIIVEDGDDGSAKWAFGITVSAGSGAAAPAEPSAAEQQRPRKRGWNPEDAQKAPPGEDEGEALGVDEGTDG